LHAIARNRLLMARALGYAFEPEAPVRHGLATAGAASSGKVFCLHGTARPEKEYPEADWLALARGLVQAGLTPVFPAGNAGEARRAQGLAQGCPGAEALPRMPLAELVPQLAAATAVIGVDTGLMHLAAALGKTGVGLYPATDPARFGAVAEAGAPAIVNLSDAADLRPEAVLAAFLALIRPVPDGSPL
jgi:heptosyltransferase-1